MCNSAIATRANNNNVKNFSQIQVGNNDNIQKYYEEAHLQTTNLSPRSNTQKQSKSQKSLIQDRR
jgi:hypothetical protein